MSQFQLNPPWFGHVPPKIGSKPHRGPLRLLSLSDHSRRARGLCCTFKELANLVRSSGKSSAVSMELNVSSAICATLTSANAEIKTREWRCMQCRPVAEPIVLVHSPDMHVGAGLLASAEPSDKHGLEIHDMHDCFLWLRFKLIRFVCLASLHGCTEFG